MRLTLGLGSGLARRAGDPPGRVWGLGDRGPNLKVPVAVERYGLDHLSPLADLAGAKVLPMPDFTPSMVELQVHDDRVEPVRTLPLRAPGGLMSGRALPGSAEAAMEPTFDLAGRPLPPDPRGVDTEGLAALSDGGFWVGEEYGPSLMKVDADGVVRRRWVPPGLDLPGAEPVLPAWAGRRHLNRGFEGVAVSPDERSLHVVLQSAPEGWDPATTLIWTLDAETGAQVAEHVYPFDPAESFLADHAAGEAEASGLKVCDLACVGPGRLLVLERVTRSARLYRVDLDRPGRLSKRMVFSTDAASGVAQDLEGVAVLSPRELLMVTDNDYGTEGAPTAFYRLGFDVDVAEL
jgi:hypothetical protein